MALNITKQGGRQYIFNHSTTERDKKLTLQNIAFLTHLVATLVLDAFVTLLLYWGMVLLKLRFILDFVVCSFMCLFKMY